MTFFQAGPKNTICDVEGIRVGNAHDVKQKTGVTVLVPDAPAVCAVDVRGGGPGTRETDLLRSESTVQSVHALVLSGGSAFGLDAASEVLMCLAQDQKGFDVAGKVRVPIVPQAILFDLLNGGDKPWLQGAGDTPYKQLARQAYQNKSSTVALGAVGAGSGATTATGQGGLGSASTLVDQRFTVGAVVAVNACGSVYVGKTGRFHAAPFEISAEFGGLGIAPQDACFQSRPALKGGDPDAEVGQNTTIGIIATDLNLDRAALERVASMAHDGLARSIWPVHAPLDGDTLFLISTGKVEPQDQMRDVTYLGQAAAQTLARAVARGVYEGDAQSNP